MEGLQHRQLLPFDQLAKEKTAGRVFRGLTEGAVNFPPTYKFDKGTSRYERSTGLTVSTSFEGGG